MDFDYIINILKSEVDLSNATVNEFRECIKNLSIPEAKRTKIQGMIPKPWNLVIDPDDGKPAIYNQVAEIIDNYVAGITTSFLTKDIRCLREYKNISARLIEKRKNEISKSLNDIKKEQYIYLPVIGSAKERIEQIITVAELN